MAPRATASFSSRIAQRGGDALPRETRMHIKQIEMILALQRSKADRRTFDGRDQRELTRKPLAEFAFVAGPAQASRCASE